MIKKLFMLMLTALLAAVGAFVLNMEHSALANSQLGTTRFSSRNSETCNITVEVHDVDPGSGMAQVDVTITLNDSTEGTDQWSTINVQNTDGDWNGGDLWEWDGRQTSGNWGPLTEWFPEGEYTASIILREGGTHNALGDSLCETDFTVGGNEGGSSGQHGKSQKGSTIHMCTFPAAGLPGIPDTWRLYNSYEGPQVNEDLAEFYFITQEEGDWVGEHSVWGHVDWADTEDTLLYSFVVDDNYSCYVSATHYFVPVTTEASPSMTSGEITVSIDEKGLLLINGEPVWYQGNFYLGADEIISVDGTVVTYTFDDHTYRYDHSVGLDSLDMTS